MIWLMEWHQYLKFLLLILPVHDIDVTAKELNSQLKKLVNGLFNEKCNLILIPINRQMKLIFSGKTNNSSHPPVAFNNNDIKKYHHHKHLDIFLDSKLDFKFHVDQKIKKT